MCCRMCFCLLYLDHVRNSFPNIQIVNGALSFYCIDLLSIQGKFRRHVTAHKVARSPPLALEGRLLGLANS